MCARAAPGASTFDIRVCQSGNIPEVCSVLAKSPEAAQWSEQAIADVLAASPGYHLVGLLGGKIAGFVSGRRMAVDGEILNLAVKPEFRRQGLGEALVRVVLERFDREGVSHVFLEVRESNHTAISFYERLGFRPIDRREAYYRDPPAAALVLARRMPPHPPSLPDAKDQVL
jgi:[ribosomal protein S18]-alanine N-acetyltransferase